MQLDARSLSVSAFLPNGTLRSGTTPHGRMVVRLQEVTFDVGRSFVQLDARSLSVSAFLPNGALRSGIGAEVAFLAFDDVRARIGECRERRAISRYRESAGDSVRFSHFWTTTHAIWVRERLWRSGICCVVRRRFVRCAARCAVGAPWRAARCAAVRRQVRRQVRRGAPWIWSVATSGNRRFGKNVSTTEHCFR